MTADDRAAWIGAAVDALEGIRADEVAAVSAELRRSVTRVSQIVPEIANLVADKRKRFSGAMNAAPPTSALERRIDEEARDRWHKATCRADYEEVWKWERRARLDAGLPVKPLAPPLTETELARLPDHIAALGLKVGHLERRNGRLIEVAA
jgi:hypothetical protein